MTTDIQTTSFHIVHSLIFLNFKKELDCSGTKLQCFFSLVVDAIHLKKETGSISLNKKKRISQYRSTYYLRCVCIEREVSENQ